MKTSVVGLMRLDFVFQFLDPFGGFQDRWALRVEGVPGARDAPIVKGNSILFQKRCMFLARSGDSVHTF